MVLWTFLEVPELTSQLYNRGLVLFHGCGAETRNIYNILLQHLFTGQEVKNDVQIQLVAGPDGGADAWLDCSPPHAR